MTENARVVLVEVRSVGSATVAEIAANTGLAESSVRYALRQLEGEGLITSDNYNRGRRGQRGRLYMRP